RPDQRYWQCEHCHRNGHPDRACNTFSLDVSMSNTNAAAYTASVLTFSYGQQSKTITVNTRLTSSPVSAGITGTANGVSATGDVTVNPIYVSSVTVYPNVVYANSGTTGTVTLSYPLSQFVNFTYAQPAYGPYGIQTNGSTGQANFSVG